MRKTVLSTELASKLAGYYRIYKDLDNVQIWLAEISRHSVSQREFCLDVYQQASASPNELQRVAIKGLLISAITVYAKCFVGASGRGVKLEEVNLPRSLRPAHRKIMDWRHNFAAHGGVSDLERCEVVLLQSESGEVLGLEPELKQVSNIGADALAQFVTVVDAMMAHTKNKIAILKQKVESQVTTPEVLLPVELKPMGLNGEVNVAF